MAKLSQLERAIVNCSGIAAEAVADGLGVPTSVVRRARHRLGQDDQDGTARAVSRPSGPHDASHRTSQRDARELERMMRSNRSLCG